MDARHLLLVEDSPGDIRLMQEALAKAESAIELSVATDGEQALAFLRRVSPMDDAPRPALVLLDLNMPKLDGREVLAAMKADPELCLIPVVVFSTSDAGHDIEACYRLGANGYVTKPVTFTAFVEFVSAIEDFWFGLIRQPPRDGSDDP